MRRPFQKLMEMAAALDWEDSQVTLGQLAQEWDEPIDRVMDAIDAWRVCCGEQTYISTDQLHDYGADMGTNGPDTWQWLGTDR